MRELVKIYVVRWLNVIFLIRVYLVDARENPKVLRSLFL